MRYIVLDLEWNQCPAGKNREDERIPFEIIEIGAVMLDDDRHPVSSFSSLIHPTVYKQLHFRTRQILKIPRSQLKAAPGFLSVALEFVEWMLMDTTPDQVMLCTWGSSDLVELQRNFKYYGLDYPFKVPTLYYDIQKLYSRCYSDGKSRVALEQAVTEQSIPIDREFHRAYDDAYYTALLFEQLDFESVKPFLSVDYYISPEDAAHELKLKFPGYTKFVSTGFSNKDDILRCRRVTLTRCTSCGKSLRKEIRWFSPSTKTYLSLSKCPEHGWLKGKIRVKKDCDNLYFAVRTCKLVDDESAQVIINRRDELREKRRRKRKSDSNLNTE